MHIMRPSLAGRATSVGLLAVTFFAGCGNEDSETSPYVPTAGQRLVPLYRKAATTRVFDGWFDRSLNARCEFVTTEDGKQRCLPGGALVGLFSDSSCTREPVARACPGQSYALEYSGAQLSAAARAVMAASGPGGAFAVEDQQCVDVSAKVQGTVAVSVGEPLPPETFVAAETATERLTDRLDARVSVGSDGSRSISMLLDHASGLVCNPFWTSSGYRCLTGQWSFFPPYYADKNCTLPLAASGVVDTPSQSLIVTRNQLPALTQTMGPSGEPEAVVYRLQPVTDATIMQYQVTPSGCLPIGATSSDHMFVGVEQLDTSTMPPLQPAKTPVRAETATQVADSEVIFGRRPLKMYRKDRMPCTVGKLRDGRTACLAAPSLEIELPLDERCQRSVATFHDATMSPSRTLRLRNDSLCLGWTYEIVELRAIATEQLPLFSHTSTPGVCVSGNAQFHPGHPAFEMGAVIEPTADDLILGDAVQ